MPKNDAMKAKIKIICFNFTNVMVLYKISSQKVPINWERSPIWRKENWKVLRQEKLIDSPEFRKIKVAKIL